MTKLALRSHRSRQQRGRERLLHFAFGLLLPGLCASSSVRSLSLSASGVWTKQQSGTLAWLHAVHFLDDERGWAVGGKGVLLATTDGGRHWQLKKSPTGDALRDVYFTDAETGWLVCERNIYLLTEADEARSYLLHTTDGGEHWQRVEAAGADVDARLVRVVFADRERGFVFGELGALYATGDGGRTWARRRLPTRRLLLGATFLDAEQGWIVGAGATLLQTSDGGATWREGRLDSVTAGAVPLPASSSAATARAAAAAPPRLNAVSFVDGRAGWAVGAAGAIVATTDGGRVWRALSSPTEMDLYDVKFFDRKEGWTVGTGGTILHTTDGGATWRVEMTPTTHPLERLCFTNRAHGWAVGFGGTIMAYAPPAPSAPRKTPQLRGVASSTPAANLR